MTLFGPSGFPIARIESLRIYEPSRHRFFDALVEFLGAFSGVMYALNAQRDGSVKAFGPKQMAAMMGTKASGVALAFFPHFILDPLVRNSWPTEVRLAEFPFDKLPSGPGTTIDSVARLNAGLLESSFVRYFEDHRSSVETRYGTDVRSWPGEWNFARILRNAFAHGGRIHFEGKNPEPVRWRNVAYSPADNGREVTFRDITPVELILLLEDVDKFL